MILLSKSSLHTITAPGIEVPAQGMFDLPERILQFGTGVLLRGLPDYFVDKANRQGVFNGRIVVVKSTDSGSVDEFDRQNGLYTIHIKGIQNGQHIDEQIINSAISRVLSASSSWREVLQVAHNPDLQIVISNTTEVGLQLVEEDIRQQPPSSFPSKLLAVLYERYKAFSGSEQHGLVIIPTELITDNGKKLKEILTELAHCNQLEPDFIHWLNVHNTICNSLVDRIVPGKPNPEMAKQLEANSAYHDQLRIIAEPYALWAIEGDEKVAEALSFSQTDNRVIIAPDIEQFRELKLRLLNGTHTLCCAIAFLSGFETVKAAMSNPTFLEFIETLMLKEIATAIPYPVEQAVATSFAAQVLDRFRNPYLEHQWLSISLQYSTKMKLRVVPLLLNFYTQYNTTPKHIALGFAAYLRFMKTNKIANGRYQGQVGKTTYWVNDSEADQLYQLWLTHKDVQTVVRIALQNTHLWDADLSTLPGFAETVTQYLEAILHMEETTDSPGSFSHIINT